MLAQTRGPASNETFSCLRTAISPPSRRSGLHPLGRLSLVPPNITRMTSHLPESKPASQSALEGSVLLDAPQQAKEGGKKSRLGRGNKQFEKDVPEYTPCSKA
jgi:hypothetical protein